eukprot:Phypoly_transcript_16118.p1 GENE.Phypoly_transcript_16118~~Phypoly_transcript_16118.p1  ORF type:complete len:269 (+),score=50.34 Phypoly_transcript_16118:38-808(+)
MALALSSEEAQNLENIKRNCELLSQQLRGLQTRIDYKQSALPANTPVKLQALIEKERAYRAEIEFTKQQHVTSVSGLDQKELQSQVHTELTTLVDELEDYKKELKVMVEKAEQDLAKDKEKLQEQVKINVLLKQKLENTETKERPETLHDIEGALIGVTGKLKKFLDKHYPIPDLESESDKGTKKRKKNEVAGFEESNRSTLLDLLKFLTGSYATDPTMYVDVSGYWRPYVDLLVMAGIATQHAHDSVLMRLVDFE